MIKEFLFKNFWKLATLYLALALLYNAVTMYSDIKSGISNITYVKCFNLLHNVTVVNKSFLNLTVGNFSLNTT